MTAIGSAHAAQTQQLPSVLLQGVPLLGATCCDALMQSFGIAIPGIIIDMLAGMGLLPDVLGMAQLGVAPLKNTPRARTSVAIRRADDRADMVRNIRPRVLPFKVRPWR